MTSLINSAFLARALWDLYAGEICSVYRACHCINRRNKEFTARNDKPIVEDVFEDDKDDCRNEESTARNDKPTMKTTMKYGKAQADFIRFTRESIDADQNHFFDDKDWRNLTIKGGRYVGLNNRKIELSSFDVKPVAAWVPHLLIPNHVPSCPNCEHARSVVVATSTWIASPKILYGLKGHRYLDTKMYNCKGCCKSFSGYNLKSMELDANKLIGFFGFNLSRSFAVDDELYNEIVNSSEEATASLQRRLAQNVKDQYLSDFQYYLFAVRQNQIKVTSSSTVNHDDQQTTLDKHLQPIQVKTEYDRHLERLDNQLKKAQWRVAQAEVQDQDPICFVSLLKIKSARNSRGKFLQGLGPSKLKDLIEEKITNGRHLLLFDDPRGKFRDRTGRSPLGGWKKLVSTEFQIRKDNLVAALMEKKIAEKNYWSHKNLGELSKAEDSGDTAGPMVTDIDDDPPEKVPLLPELFSKMEEPTAYNARFLSKSRIDSILATEYHHRRPVQLGKMFGLTGVILKIDFNYKLAKKMRVWNGRGLSFRPYKCIVTIQNEDGLTVFWRVLKGSESFKEIREDLVRLKNRLESNNATMNLGEIKAIYVDNCCSVSKSLQEIFPRAEIKLDAFHWLQRWNDELQDNSSKQAGIFRTLMSRALFTVTNEEYKRSKEELEKKLKRDATVKEILSSSRGSVGDPVLLEQRINKVLAHCLGQDYMIDWQLAQRTDEDNNQAPPVPCRFFRRSKKLNELIRLQLKHVRCGCLTDPKNVSVLRRDPRTGTVRTARGTGTNEADNLQLDRLTGGQIGVTRATRIIGSFFENNNHRKQLSRLGEEDFGTVRTEQLALLNTMVLEIGYCSDDLPFPVSSHPSEENVFGESIGFEVVIPLSETLSNPSLPLKIPSQLMDQRGLLDEDEISIDESAEVSDDVESRFDFADIDEATSVAGDSDFDSPFDSEIKDEMAKLIPTVLLNRESTMSTFLRLTQNTGWVPFNTCTLRKDDTDLAELSLFETLKDQFNPNVSPGSPKGYKNFELLWNEHVADRFQSLISGDENVVLIRPKSAQQLKDYYKHLLETKAMASFVDPNHPNMKELKEVMRDTRLKMTAPIPPETSVAVDYRQAGKRPFGTATLAANPTIGMAAMRARGDDIETSLASLSVGVVPWVYPARTNTSIENPSIGFFYQKYCSSCGFQKNDHILDVEGFGKNCKRNYCAKCNQTKENHQQSNGKMGPFCQAIGDTIWIHSPHNQWYTNAFKPRRPKISRNATPQMSIVEARTPKMRVVETATALEVGMHSETRKSKVAPAELVTIIEDISESARKNVDLANDSAFCLLKADEEAQVDELLQGEVENDEVEICKNVILRSFLTLRPGRWVGDEVINRYLRIIVSKHNEDCLKTGQRLCYAYGTQFLVRMIEIKEKVERYDYEGVRRWSRFVPGKNLFDLDKLFIPINENNVHWMLVVVSFQECCIRFYDSAKRDRHSGPDQKYLKWIKMYIRDEHKLPLDDWKTEVTPPDTPTQENGYDCGVFVCSFVELILAGRALTFGQEDITRKRNRIAWTLIQAGKTDDDKVGKG
jgi:sentrin-specific protease 1